MRILDKYLYKKLFIYLLVILPSISFVTILVELIEILRKIKIFDVSALFMYIIYKLPEKLYFMLPVSVVIVVALLIKDLIQTREIYPILLNGISLKDLGKRIFIFSFIFSLLQILNLETILPEAQKRAEKIYKILRKKDLEETKKLLAFNTWIALDKRTFMYFDILDFDTKSGKNAIVLKLDKDFKPVLRIEGKSFFVKENKILFFNGKVINLKNPFDFSLEKFREYPFFMNMNIEEFKKLIEIRKPISLKELYTTAKIAEKYGYPASYYWSKFYQKLATVFSPLFLVFAAYPFLWKQKAKYIGIVVILLVFYWYGSGLLSSLAESNVIPYVSVFSIDILYLIIGFIFLRKLDFQEF
ncbi:MAG: YjgP/YjgQ family permease [Aquificae bacterium]|nr:YjgP/YjgQ family permease [Aquificota bacterium]